jgi:hypothetical protein
MDLIPVSSGRFDSFRYHNETFYRLRFQDGAKWYRYQSSLESFKELLCEYILISKLEEEYSLFIRPIKKLTENKSELNTEEVFNFVVDAIKNRTNYTSFNQQPNSTNKLIVESNSKCSSLYICSKRDAYLNRNTVAAFYDDHCIVFPLENVIRVNLKKLYGLLFLFLHREYSIQLYHYRENKNGYTQQIWRHKINPSANKNEKMFRNFDEPITILFRKIINDNDDNFTNSNHKTVH